MADPPPLFSPTFHPKPDRSLHPEKDALRMFPAPFLFPTDCSSTADASKLVMSAFISQLESLFGWECEIVTSNSDPHQRPKNQPSKGHQKVWCKRCHKQPLAVLKFLRGQKGLEVVLLFSHDSQCNLQRSLQRWIRR
jgi:hypothetical protein